MVKPHTYFNRFEEQQSELLTLSGGAGTIEFDINNSRVHNFAGVVFFNDPQGSVFVTPTAGMATFTVKLVVQPQAFQAIPNNVLDVTVACQVNWAGNTLSVQVDLTGVTGVSHARLITATNSA